MKQLLYASVSAGDAGCAADVGGILEQSRHNNAIDGVTGLLWTDGQRFLQVIEGDEDAVDSCFARITNDPRHRDLVVIVDREIENREFGYWSMAHRKGDLMADEHDRRVRRMLEGASSEVSAPFLELVAVPEAA